MVRTRSHRAQKEQEGPEDHRARSRPAATKAQKPIASTSRKSNAPNAQASSSATQSTPTVDPAWRSRVGGDSKINKTAALAKYKLKPVHLEGLSCEKSQTMKNGRVVPMYLYNEREVEKKAWELYRGPDKFKEKLDALREEHARKKLKSPFQAPDAYSAQGPSITVGRLSPPPGGYVPFDITTYEPYTASSPILQNIKRQMAPWLWKECITAMNNFDLMQEPSAQGLSKRATEEAMQQAFRNLAPKYPPRPAEHLPSSPSVDALRAILEEAPRYPPPEDRERSHDNLDMSGNSYPDFEWEFEWSKGYLGRIFHALRDVIDAHGMGERGWASARWEIYEKYKERMTDGIRCSFYRAEVVARRGCEVAARGHVEGWPPRALRGLC